MKTKKLIKLPFNIKIPSLKGIKNGERLKVSSTQVILSGTLITWLALSVNSGFIDLVFFSGLSKSLYGLFGVFTIPAGVVMCLMSLGFTFGKAFVSMKLAALKELQVKLKEYGATWTDKLNKPKLKLNFIHKFLVGISIITSISLSIISIGDAIRKNQNVIKRVNTDIERIQKYANTTDKSDEVQFTNLIQSSSASTNAVNKSAEQAAKIWPIIEEYRTERAEFEAQYGATFASTDEVEWRGQTIIPNDYWDKQNSLVQNKVKAAGRTMSITQIRNVTSEAVLASQIKSEIESQAKNTSSDELASLSKKTTEAAANEIKNLEGRYTWPVEYIDKEKAGQVVEFDPNNITGAITILSDVKAAYENDNGDVGDSAKMFMLIGPSIEKAFEKQYDSLEEASKASVSTSSFGATEIMMMILIMLFGIAQEYLIAIFTPEAIIDRKLLSNFKGYLGKFDKNDFLLDVYEDYLGIGIINQEEYEAKAKKCVVLSEHTKADAYSKYSKKAKQEQETVNSKIKNAVDAALKSQQLNYDTQIQSLTKELEEERNKEPQVVEKEVIKEVPVEKIVEKIVEVPVEKIVEKIVEVPAEKKPLPVRPKAQKEKKQEGYGADVENAIADLKNEFGDLL